ncbi:cyclic nucleotide-binding domain-containing protein 1 [Perognathus longimembris pacificus]|uniref:cyclic nucleotide-binding domain-containing protein 1 n=1 Tax=Perognathus longimembris pacificus TaxID=214514 RepID=UPI00201974E1|nr:cyclic nucleotide-binding domain-containing protein 1 [Perognathus longimembris pacificus]
MPMSSLPAAIYSHMIAIENVPPPPLRNIPSLKVTKNINYGQLNALCHIRGLRSRYHSRSPSNAHNEFIKKYPKIFLQKPPRLPKILIMEKQRKQTEKTEGKNEPDDLHNVTIHIKKAHGMLKEKEAPEKFAEFLAILKKLPVHRTRHEHNTVWNMLKTLPDLSSQLDDQHLKKLSKKVISQTWVKGSTVIGDDGFYVILKGMARPRMKIFKNLAEKSDSMSFLLQNSEIFDLQLKSSTLAEIYVPRGDMVLRRWNTFGTLEEIAGSDLEIFPLSVVTEEDCEILKISAKDYASFKLKNSKYDKMQKLKLIRQCPYYTNWPTLSIYELISFSKWKKFPPNHVIVESGEIISFLAFINSGYCNIYRSIVGLVKQPLNKVKKVRKLVYMGRLKEKESFGEISVLLQTPVTCTIITGTEVEMAIIEDVDLFGKYLDYVTRQLMLQTAKPTFGHLKEEDVKYEYIRKEKEKEWKHDKDVTLSKSLFHNGIVPGFGRWTHEWTSIPRNLKDVLIN